jgi:hypothetical protein
MLLAIIFSLILAAVVVLAAVGLLVYERISWRKMIIELIFHSLPISDEDVKFQVAKYLSRGEQEKAEEKRKRKESKKRRKELGRKVDNVDTEEKKVLRERVY